MDAAITLKGAMVPFFSMSYTRIMVFFFNWMEEKKEMMKVRKLDFYEKNSKKFFE